MFVELLDNHATLAKGTRVRVIGEGYDWFRTKKYFLPKSICRKVYSDKEFKVVSEKDYDYDYDYEAAA